MSVLVLESGRRRARKAYRCQLCDARIRPGDTYAYQNSVYDNRVYTWRDCLHCDRDRVVDYVDNWIDPDDGVTFESAYEWATEAMSWPYVYRYSGRHIPMKAAEHEAARNWLARAEGAE